MRYSVSAARWPVTSTCHTPSVRIRVAPIAPCSPAQRDPHGEDDQDHPGQPFDDQEHRRAGQPGVQPVDEQVSEICLIVVRVAA